MPPAAIGPFIIEHELGRGGMGEVYLARDTRLDRLVAIKALPAHLSQDPDRLARFQREAKVLASLNHPGIAAIYGLEESGGQQHLILEFVDGETLAEILARGPIPVSDCLSIARQMAEALEIAHDKGVIHRDLKPSNVMVTGEGVVKVLDFGLARAEDVQSPSSAVNLAQSPTVVSPARAHSPTIPGAIMGTAGYMSPEQARGKPVDKRSDIFSFGCVFYEMLTGAMPFQGETVADAIGATLHKETDLALLPAETPRRVRDLLTACLAKDRRNRLHDMGDARLELERAAREPGEAMSGSADARRQRSAALPWAIVGVMAVVAGTFPLWSERAGFGTQVVSTPERVVRFTIEPPEGYSLPLLVGNGSGIAISPAGDRIVFTANANGKSYLCVRDLADGTSRVLSSMEDSFNPFFSPDGQWIGFVCKNRLMKMPANGGPAITLCDITNFASFAWLDDGTIAWGASNSGVWRVDADGGEPMQLVEAGPDSKAPEGGKVVLGFDVPLCVPGSDYILCGSWDGPSTESFNVQAVSLKDGSVRTILRTATEPRLIAHDRLVFMRGTTLMTVGFDPARGVIVGEPTVALEGIRTDQWCDSAYIGASHSGTFAYVPGGRFGSDRRLVQVDERGSVTPLLESTDNYSAAPVVSPNGRKAVISTLRSEVEMWLLDLERRSMSLLSSTGEQYAPAWSVDGQSIMAQLIALDGTWSLARWPVGGGDPELLPNTSSKESFITPFQEVLDGSGLVVQIQDLSVSGNPDIALYDYASASITPLRDRPSAEADACISPDGKWLAYASDESGRHEVYLGPLGSSGPNIQVSTQGGYLPRFSRDGRRLFFAADPGVMMAAAIEFEGTVPRVAQPSKLFDFKPLNLLALSGRGGFDVLPTGGFLMIERAAWEEEPPAIHVILNWNEELGARRTSR